MKYIVKLLTYTVSIFTALSIVYAALCQLGISEPVPFARTAFRILIASVVTAVYITLRDILTKDRFWPELISGVIGCTFLIVVFGAFLGWFELTITSVITVFLITVVVYLFVWLINMLQGRKDANELNRLIVRSRKEKDERQAGK